MLNHPRAGSGYGRPTGGGRSCEYAYEALGAVVYDQRESWYLIEFIRDSTRLLGWVSERHSGAFHSLEHLLRDGLAFLTAAWDQRLYATPRAFLTTSPPADRHQRDINVKQTRMSGGILWLEVEILAPGHCAAGERPRVTARGWIPACLDRAAERVVLLPGVLRQGPAPGNRNRAQRQSGSQ